MKKLTIGFYLFIALVAFGADGVAQDKLIVLVRHAEKADASADSELSVEGKERARRLVKKIGKFRPKEIYSTDFKRTRDTVQPLAAKRHVQIQAYDPRKPQDLADKILKSDHKRILVSGHSNTVPGLANLLGKKELFKNLDDSEYGAIWVIRIKKGQVQKVEILNY
jgi:2,3-bisphosphoglycerate-dependent phosphoglycerate mutase